jgi:hypothetical protein
MNKNNLVFVINNLKYCVLRNSFTVFNLGLTFKK